MLNYFQNPFLTLALQYLMSGGMTQPAGNAEIPFVLDPGAQADYIDENLKGHGTKYNHNDIARVVENVFDFSHHELVDGEASAHQAIEAEVEYKNAVLAAIRLAAGKPAAFDNVDRVARTPGFVRARPHYGTDFDAVLASAPKHSKREREKVIELQ